MRRIRIVNPILNRNYKTFIDADISSGTTVTVESNNSFAANDFLVAGEPREELTELRQVSSISGNTTININSAFRFVHPKGTPLYKTPWDFVSIERRTSSTGTFAEISQSAIQWDNSNNETVYFDSAATSAYQYRFRFYNSSTVTYSEYSATLTGVAADRTSVSYLIRRVRKFIQDEEKKIVQDDELIRAFNRAQDIIYSHNPRYWFLYVNTYQLGSLSILATANTNVYSLNSLTNYGELAGILYRYTSGGSDQLYRLRQISEPEFDRLNSNLKRSPLDWPTVYKLLPADATSANGYFQITPSIQNSGIGTFYPLYYYKMANMDTPDDTTLVPLPDLLVDYAIAYAERIKDNETKAELYSSSIEERVITIRGRMVIVEPKGLKMLDKMDQAKKRSISQPQNLFNFRGQKAITRLFGNKFSPIQSMDYYRENYF